ncbi:hypothetical protein [Dyella agri]|uniref:Uncharacterized protein n=1 Tax=Dyella agri TaxID=1926869 RepID=A0ABW8KIW7_9GAMM
MKIPVQKIGLLVILVSSACASAMQAKVRFIKFPDRDAETLGEIDKLSVNITCSRISRLSNIPELYDIHMGYEMPAQNAFEAVPRLGAAAVDLRKWSNVIGVSLPANPDDASCFSVTVTAEGRGDGVSVVTHKWTGRELGF